jgi:hypothetical protein
MEYKILNNITGERDMTSDEITAYNNIKPKASDKLKDIKEIRLEKLKETDYLANSDVTMPDNIKTWRQSLRDIPQDNTTEEKYDELLERKDDGSLKHSIWEKP